MTSYSPGAILSSQHQATPDMSQNSDLKKEIERQLKRLGQIHPEQSVNFPELINELGEKGVIAKSIAQREVQEAYKLACSELKPKDAPFLANIHALLKGIPI
ncbi:MAG: hypothetical protein G01um101429_671 [Parcubacteria group bacterium Gr01-1014_29]|nr:MAG: hypothetical protein G01um101429_671 [Parcubacteria group bacterium Gr01-1014_29]